MFNTKKKPEKKPLKIIIVGCGKVGRTLVDKLNQEGNDITVIDQIPERVEEITNLYDVMGIVGNGASFSIQTEAEIENADLFIAVTDSDELNLLCCTVAKHANCSTIARVRKPDYINEAGYLKEQLGLQMIINPDLESATEIAKLFYIPSALEINSFAHGQAELIKIVVEKNGLLDGKTLSEVFTNCKNDDEKILVVTVERDGNVIIPNGDFQINADDKVTFVLPKRHRRAFLNRLNIQSVQLKSCMIIGGGITSFYLANQLIHMGLEVKIIESKPDRCRLLSELLPNAIVINGDGTDEILLREEGIDITDGFVALTGIDEQNIFLTMHAKKVSNAKVVTKITRENFKDLIDSMDLGSVIHPRTITSEAIIAYARAKRASLDYNNIETLYHMYDSRVEAIEFKVDSQSLATEKPLKELKLKDGINVAFINRNGRIIIPNGDDKIIVGDSVMIVTTNTGFTTLDDILN
ncbi:MAG: Trk system potassium transporter TrkA [Lachnospiraceae bacterium]|nr:Trk system potassium transporter TrkA [Lachnospiraceae bacterium]